MNISSVFFGAALAAIGLTGSAGFANATVTEFNSQAAFDAAVPGAYISAFSAGGAYPFVYLGNSAAFNGLTFTSNATAADSANGGTPVLFLIPATATPTYGQDFLSFQNTDVGISAEIDSVGTHAIGFTFGSYVPSGGATLTLSTGDSFAINPTSSATFIGFTSTTAITSVTVDYPNGYAFDLVSVSTVPEPATWTMMLVGFAGLGFAGYRRSKKVSALRAA
jgi:hypothetical protein